MHSAVSSTPMKKTTTTSFAILSLLALRSWSGYELSQQMRRSVGEFWPRAERGIYQEAKNLVDHGFASAVTERHGRRLRTVYSITPKGRGALRRWHSGPSRAPSFESDAILRIAFAEHGTKSDALRTLAELRAHVDERRALITNVARDYVEGRGRYPRRAHVIALVSRFFSDYYAFIDAWAEWAAREVEDWDDVMDPSSTSAAGILAEIAELRPALEGAR